MQGWLLLEPLGSRRRSIKVLVKLGSGKSVWVVVVRSSDGQLADIDDLYDQVEIVPLDRSHQGGLAIKGTSELWTGSACGDVGHSGIEYDVEFEEFRLQERIRVLGAHRQVREILGCGELRSNEMQDVRDLLEVLPSGQ